MPRYQFLGERVSKNIMLFGPVGFMLLSKDLMDNFVVLEKGNWAELAINYFKRHLVSKTSILKAS